MYFLLMKFEIPNNKIQEFDIAFKKLVKWPVYTLYKTTDTADNKVFELIHDWDKKEEMLVELESRDFTNLLGMVKVLGKILQSKVYHVSGQEDLLEINSL